MLQAYRFGDDRENVQEANPEYTEVVEVYEEDILIAGVPEAFNNFSISGFYPRQAPVHILSNYYVCLYIKF
jgi:hypothetical protein